MVVAPIMLDVPKQYMLQSYAWEVMERIRELMEKTGVPMHCDPVLATYSAIYRGNTSAHATSVGAEVRTSELADCVVQFIKGENTTTGPIDPSVAVHRVASRLAEQRINFGKGDFPVQKRLRALTELRDAIKAYKQENGSYPSSTGGNAFGTPIGLVPKWLKELQRIQQDRPPGLKTISSFIPAAGAATS